MIPGGRRPNPDGLIENLVATALYRSGAEALALADPLPGGIGYWKGANKREIDFVVPSPNRGSAKSDGSSQVIQGELHRNNQRVAIEVKGDNTGDISDARQAIRRTFGDGAVVTRTVYDWADDVPVIPLGVFLAAVGDRPQRNAAGL